MGFLRFIWKDVLSLHPAIKIVGLVVIALVVRVWYVGVGWWTRPVNVAPWYVQPRMRPRLEFYGVLVGLALLCYIIYAAERYRKSR